MTFDRFKAVSKIYYDKLKTNHNYVKVGAFLFLTVKFGGTIHSLVQGHFKEHVLKDSFFAVALGIGIYFTYKEVKQKLASKEFMDKKELADKNYQEHLDLEHIYDEKKRLDKIIAPVDNTKNTNLDNMIKESIDTDQITANHLNTEAIAVRKVKKNKI
jgi:hypothetical protein